MSVIRPDLRAQFGAGKCEQFPLEWPEEWATLEVVDSANPSSWRDGSTESE
jgi:hypothetical protein